MKRNPKKSKILSSLKKGTVFKECFHSGIGKCSEKIINSHGIQNNGRLSLLAESIDSNNKLYKISDLLRNDSKQLIGFNEIGLKEATVFDGFCQYHDAIVFSEIEGSGQFDPNNRKHFFLQSYRSLAAYFTNLNSMNNQYNSNVLGFNNYVNNERKAKRLKLERDIEFLNKLKVEFKSHITQENYNCLCCFVYVVEGTLPFGISTVYEVGRLDLQVSKYERSFLMFSVLPGVKQSYVLIGGLKDDLKVKSHISLLDNLDRLSLEKFFTHQLLVENSCFSPKLISRLTENEIGYIFKYINDCDIDFDQLNSNLNLFDMKYLI